jgi:hypothetical protein
VSPKALFSVLSSFPYTLRPSRLSSKILLSVSTSTLMTPNSISPSHPLNPLQVFLLYPIPWSPFIIGSQPINLS